MSRNYKVFRKLMAASLSILIVFMSVFIFAPTPALAAGTTYYFSTSGSDGNDGLSQSTPKQTLAAAASLMNAGNTILFKRGDKWYSPMYQWDVLNKTGTSSEPILIDAYGSGDKPIIACMELMTSGWTDLGSNRWSHPLGGYSDAVRCFVDGVSKLKVSSPDAVDAYYKFAVASSTIYIYSTTEPTNVEVINSASLSILNMTNCSYITFRNLDLRGGGKWCAVMVNDQSSHVTIDSCDVREIRLYGIQFINSTTNYNLYHESPVIKNCYLNKGWTVEENNPNQSSGGDGIDLRNAVVNGLVQGNTVVDFGHTGIAAELTEGPNYVGVNNNIFECNEVYLTCPGYTHGFDVQGIEGKATGNIFRRNYFHDITNSGHLLGNGNYVYSNIFDNIDMTTTGSTLQAFAVDIMPFTQSGMQYISKNNVFANNTIYDTEGSGIRIGGATTVYENIIKNNIVIKWVPPGTPPLNYDNYGLRNDASYQPQIVENNAFYNYSSTDKVIRQGTSYYTAQEANDAFSNYNNNIQADPLFVDPDNGNFNLQENSPCKTAGQVLTGMGTGFVDYYGNAWDPMNPSMGAIQYAGSSPTPTPDTTPTPTPETTPTPTPETTPTPTPTSTPTSTPTPTSGTEPVAQWNLNEISGTTADDSVGSNDGILYGNPVWTTGYIDGGLSFDGSGDYVDCGNGSSLLFGSSGDFSIAFWGKINTTAESYAGIVGKKLSRSANRAGYLVDLTNHKLVLQLSDGINTVSATSSSDVDNNAWHHYCVTADRDGNAQVYIDGTANGSAAGISGVGNIDDATCKFIMGSIGYRNSQYYNGALDDVCVYNRVLTSSEISALATDSTPTPTPTPNVQPVIASIGNQAVDENNEITFNFTASDPNDDAVALMASNLPDGATFDNSTGIFNWKPGFSDAGKYIIYIEASDGLLTSAMDVEITVRNVPASELTANLSNDIKKLEINKAAKELLVKQLDHIRLSLEKQKYKLAMVKLKVFMAEVKILTPRVITNEQAEAILKASLDICMAIKADAQDVDIKWLDKKVEQWMDALKQFRKGNITEEIYTDIMNKIDGLIGKMK